MQRRTFLHVAFGLTVLPLTARAGASPLALLPDLTPLRGGPVTSEALSNRLVVVTFFASWCPPCYAEFKHLNALRAAFDDADVAIVGVNLFEDFGGLSSPAKLARFIDQTQPAFPLVRGDDRAKRAFGNVDRIPTVFVFDRQGGQAWRFRHAPGARKTHVTEAELTAVLNGLLASPA